MQSSTQFKLSPQFALALIGAPFSGKTNLAFQFPRPYILDADDKLTNAVQRFPGRDFHFDCPLRRPDGMPVPETQRWTYATECLKLALVSPDVDTIVLDSASALSDFLITHILQYPSTATKSLMVGGIKVMDQSMWGPFRDLWKKLVMACRASGKLVVVCVHEEFDTDETTKIRTHRPLIPGSLKSNFNSMFTDVWRCETMLEPDKAHPGKLKTVYRVRTEATPLLSLGNAWGLPNEWEFDFAVLASKIAQLTTPKVQPPA